MVITVSSRIKTTFSAVSLTICFCWATLSLAFCRWDFNDSTARFCVPSNKQSLYGFYIFNTLLLIWLIYFGSCCIKRFILYYILTISSFKLDSTWFYRFSNSVTAICIFLKGFTSSFDSSSWGFSTSIIFMHFFCMQISATWATKVRAHSSTCYLVVRVCSAVCILGIKSRSAFLI